MPQKEKMLHWLFRLHILLIRHRTSNDKNKPPIRGFAPKNSQAPQRILVYKKPIGTLIFQLAICVRKDFFINSKACQVFLNVPPHSHFSSSCCTQSATNTFFVSPHLSHLNHPSFAMFKYLL